MKTPIRGVDGAESAEAFTLNAVKLSFRRKLSPSIFSQPNVVPMTRSRRTRFFALLIITIILTALIARLLPNARTIDDAFITFRYSRNILEGHGFVYNEGVHTLGTTTPLFAILMAAMGGVLGGRDFPHYALLVSALADAISAALLFLIACRLVGRDIIAFFPAILYAIAPMSVTFAIGGMETSLVVL